MGKNAGRSGSTWRKLSANQRAKRLPCCICRQPIDYTLTYPNEDSFSVEHIKPWSTHPELREEPTNLDSAHLRCNKAKQDKTTLPTLGNTSRNW